MKEKDRLQARETALAAIRGGYRRGKYRNTATIIDGIRFDSKREAARYAELRMLEKAGEIKRLRIHPRYQISPKIVLETETLPARFYEADFEYCAGKKKIIEDVKSPATAKNALYRLKRQLFLTLYGDLVEFVEMY